MKVELRRSFAVQSKQFSICRRETKRNIRLLDTNISVWQASGNAFSEGCDRVRLEKTWPHDPDAAGGGVKTWSTTTRTSSLRKTFQKLTDNLLRYKLAIWFPHCRKVLSGNLTKLVGLSSSVNCELTIWLFLCKPTRGLSQLSIRITRSTQDGQKIFGYRLNLRKVKLRGNMTSCNGMYWNIQLSGA